MGHAIRVAEEKDCSVILGFVKDLARYEKLEDKVVATVDSLRKTLFCENARAEALIVEEQGEPAGFALFFHSYSTFLGRYGIYVEDIYISESLRGRGLGKAVFKFICKEAVRRDCGRVEWSCLDWNKPSIDFYLSLGAEPLSDWTVYRLGENEIKQMAR